MLQGAFSFRGRIGRLNYFLAQLLIIPGAIVAGVVLAILMAGSARGPATLVVLVVFGGLMVIAALWYSLSLQVRRIRDIGWDPFVVLVGWFAISFCDVILAKMVPSMAIGQHHAGTALGSLVNIGLSLALWFWPGNGGQSHDDIVDVFSGPAAGASRLDALLGGAERFEAPAAVPAMAMSARLPGAAPQGFGRRGVR